MSEERIYRVAAPSGLIFREEDNGEQTIEGLVVPYGQWSEVDSVIEGHFLERFSFGSLAKSFSEGFARMKGYFEHGQSKMFDRTPIMALRRVWETEAAAWFEANLLRGLPPHMIDGIRHGQYGVSLGATPIKMERNTHPRKSEYNPKGLEERTYKELRAYDISLTPAPHYDTPVMLRSITDRIVRESVVKRLAIENPERLLQLLRETQEAEPTHSEPTAPDAETPEPPEDPEQAEQVEPEEKPDAEEPPADPEPEGSRATQPPHDYLADEQEEEWRL